MAKIMKTTAETNEIEMKGKKQCEESMNLRTVFQED